jgi:hypothetical protein
MIWWNTCLKRAQTWIKEEKMKIQGSSSKSKDGQQKYGMVTEGRDEVARMCFLMREISRKKEKNLGMREEGGEDTGRRRRKKRRRG